MNKTRFKVDISYNLKKGFWDTSQCICELIPEEQTPETCRMCLSRKLAVPSLYAEEKLLESTYSRQIDILQLDDRYCTKILTDGSICNNLRVFSNCKICEKPFCEDHLNEAGICESDGCQEEFKKFIKIKK